MTVQICPTEIYFQKYTYVFIRERDRTGLFKSNGHFRLFFFRLEIKKFNGQLLKRPLRTVRNEKAI